ncbi:MAG: hypothetical protein MJ139_06930, partial [Limosilactobacillus sp.]|nr:hypothetical protein [Limosilactobacillus sp.]
FPANWVHYDQSSLNMMPELFAGMVSDDALWVAYDQQSLGGAVMRQQPVFMDFGKFKEAVLKENESAHGKELDYQFDKSLDRQIGQQKAFELVGHYLQAVPVMDKDGQQIGLKSRRVNQHFLAIDWPVGGVTTIKCEEAANAPMTNCGSIFSAISLAQPDLSMFMAGEEPIVRDDFTVGAPKGWYKILSGVSKGDLQRLPPAIRVTYNPQEDVNIISPDTNYLITLNKVDFNLPLEEQDQIEAWGQNIFENASQQSQNKPTYLGVTEVNGLQQVTIDDLAFRTDNPKIKTRLVYVLNNNYAVVTETITVNVVKPADYTIKIGQTITINKEWDHTSNNWRSSDTGIA